MTTTLFLRAMLLGEALFYALVAWLLFRAGWHGTAVASVIVVMALAGRAFVISSTYIFAALFRTAVAPDQRVGPLGFLGMALAEYAAFSIIFTVIQPFERFWLGADRLGGNKDRLPLLLVHGFQCNRGFWFWQRRRLEQAGWTVATLNLDPMFASIDSYGELIDLRIAEVLAATGAAKLILVGHSMGGLALRAYLRAHGKARVAKLITLGSPHHGSRLAMLGAGINARQMEPESVWLDALNRPGAAQLPSDTVSVRSLYDNYVMPQDSSLLANARNVVVGPVGHLSMAFAPSVTKLLLAELGATESVR